MWNCRCQCRQGTDQDDETHGGDDIGIGILDTLKIMDKLQQGGNLRLLVPERSFRSSRVFALPKYRFARYICSRFLNSILKSAFLSYETREELVSSTIMMSRPYFSSSISY
jgi:hypothetical protein